MARPSPSRGVVALVGVGAGLRCSSTKGSAESKDSDEKMEASLRRIEEQLGTLPGDAPSSEAERWKLPHTGLKVADRASDTPNELETLSRDELYELAQQREVPGRSDMT